MNGPIMKSKYLLILILYSGICLAQQTNAIQYIYDEDPLINSDETGQLHYLIYVESEDVQFNSDSYKFIVPNRTGFEQYKNLDRMEEEIALIPLTIAQRRN